MDKMELKTQFEEFLKNNGENPKKLEQAISTFKNDVFDMFLNWLELYRDDSTNSYKKVFLIAVIPLMRNKLDIFWMHDFRDETYERYESLFISFMKFARKNSEYINNLMLDRRKEKLENLVEWEYWKNFDKKSFLKAWHDYIAEDTWKNWDKHRKYLADIYWHLSNRQLQLLYEIFFNSYEICSKVNSKNNEHKWDENYKKRDAFCEAFLNLENNTSSYSWEKLGEIKSLFWKYLNFIPKYRDRIFDTMNWETEWWVSVQRETEQSLIDDLSEGDRTIDDEDSFGIDENPIIYENVGWRAEWDWFWPIKVIRRSRDENRWIYDQTERWDIIAPIDYWIFPDSDIQESWDENWTE